VNFLWQSLRITESLPIGPTIPEVSVFFTDWLRVLRIQIVAGGTGGFDGKPTVCQNVFVARCESRNVFFRTYSGMISDELQILEDVETSHPIFRQFV
jgi:hypothetical protein